MADISITIPDDFKKELQQFGNNIAKNIAITAREELSAEYIRAVDMFYSAYSPQKYKRHYTLYNSFTKFYRNPHGNRVRGGIEISANGMAEVHHDSSSTVLDTALIGYHGRPKLGIVTSPSIIDHIMRYRDLLYANIDAYADGAISGASGNGKYF